MLDLKRLLALREVARLRSFSAAALELSLTQSAVSQQISSLEQQLGLALLDRGPPIVPTPAGEILVERAGHALDHLAAAETELGEFRGLRTGRLRVGAFASAASALLPAVLPAFRERQPDVQIALRQLEPKASSEALRRGEIDLALTFRYLLAPVHEPALAMQEHLLFEEDLLVALPAAHPHAGSAAVSLEQLAGDAWIEAQDAGVPLGLLAGRTSAPGFHPRVVFEGDDFAAVLGLVAAEAGVALVPPLAIKEVPRGVVLRSVAPRPLRRAVYAVTLATGRAAPATSTMLELLAAAGRDHARRASAAARTRNEPG